MLQLELFLDSQLPISVLLLSLTFSGNLYNVQFQLSPELYQRIDDEALFNLKPEIRSPLSNGEFKPAFDIQIEAALDPALLPTLTANATNAEEAAAYLQKLSQEQPNHPILSVYSWYALEVKQKHDQGETGYTTLWKYLNPSLITPDGIDPQKMNEAMNNFVKDWTNTNHSDLPEDVINQTMEEMLGEITETFEELTNSLSETTEEIISETMAEMNSAVEELADTLEEMVEEIEIEVEKQNIFDLIIEFFKEEEWQFQVIPKQKTLRLLFQGNNGQWDCYAIAKEKEQQFIFYSICPLTIAEPQKIAIAEYITRANSGMIMGNFELDIDQGQVKYKTSIDVEGDQLSLALIKQIVYPNVMMMDKYLSGIIAVVDNHLSPQAAISQIEQ
ncbi:MAG: YbjN domain-containing protein [Microcystaceae cyanobacterium]